MHYTGWTTDGKMFDSSVARGEPATFPLNGVIPGWTEGVQLMVVGEKTRFWIPGNLAYDNRPAPARPRACWCSTSSCSRSSRRARRCVTSGAGGDSSFALRRAGAGVTCATTGPPPPAHLLPVGSGRCRAASGSSSSGTTTAGVAGVVLAVDVGSVDDPPGKHGLAHTLEHLVFRAPDAGGVRCARGWSGGRRLVQRRRPASRRTTYWPSVRGRRWTSCWRSSSGGWPTRCAAIDDELFAKEASIVAEELRMREGAARAAR